MGKGREYIEKIRASSHRIDQDVISMGNISGVVIFDMAVSNVDAILNGDVTSIVFSNNPSADKRVTSILNIVQDSVTGNWGIDWVGSGVIPSPGLGSGDLQPQIAVDSVTEYYLRWDGLNWRIIKVEIGGEL